MSDVLPPEKESDDRVFLPYVSRGPDNRRKMDSKRTVSETGRSSFSARSGKHDDLVLSVALAVFGLKGARRGGEFSIGYYRI
jgi:hypothetical protein